MGVWHRATTPEARHIILAEIEAQWNVPPDMRLGQLIYNAVGWWLLNNKKPAAARDISNKIFYIEDDDLMTMITAFVTEKYPRRDSASTSF